MKRIFAMAVASFLAGPFARADKETNSEVLKKVWETGRQHSCSAQRGEFFSESAFKKIQAQIHSESDRKELAAILNPYLFSIGYSHTQLFTEEDESYYLFKGLFAEQNPQAPAAPQIINPGIQVGSDDHGYFVREALHGFAPRTQGLVKGDRILSVDGVPFMGRWGRQAKKEALVRIVHQGQQREVHLPLLSLNWSQAFQDATLNSIQTLAFEGHKIGYVKLWSGVHPDSASALWSAVKKFKAAAVEAVVLDLRGGYGGALWPHLDPFFADRTGYFVLSATDGEGKSLTMKPKPQQNPGAFLGPMVVLIDEGSRSGKEALAYQFKKSKRAMVIGTSTPGYFSGGETFFADAGTDYLLFLCIARDGTLDGVNVEGIGIQPDLSVGFDVHNEFQDSQLKLGLEKLKVDIESHRE